MKRTLIYNLILGVSLIFSAMNFSPDALCQNKNKFLAYEVIQGDTVYVDDIRPSWIYPKGKRKGKDWRQYYRLVHNFSKVYPYAMVARTLVIEADSTIAANNFTRVQKEKYVSSMQKELFNVFEDQLKHLTISQGALLIRLIDREVGKSSYSIIKDYKNGIAAGFWQGVAKIFRNDLKSHYDPDGADAATEHLVQMWENGLFPDLYVSIFGKLPPLVEIPSKYRKEDSVNQSLRIMN